MAWTRFWTLCAQTLIGAVVGATAFCIVVAALRGVFREDKTEDEDGG